MKLKLDFLTRAFEKVSPWLGKAFSDSGTPSSSRLMTIPHSLTAIFCAVYMTVKTGGHPDGMALTALGGFATVHYAINRATTAWSKDNTPKLDASAEPSKV
jgi:hypothetical protein